MTPHILYTETKWNDLTSPPLIFLWGIKYNAFKIRNNPSKIHQSKLNFGFFFFIIVWFCVCFLGKINQKKNNNLWALFFLLWSDPTSIICVYFSYGFRNVYLSLCLKENIRFPTGPLLVQVYVYYRPLKQNRLSVYPELHIIRHLCQDTFGYTLQSSPLHVQSNHCYRSNFDQPKQIASKTFLV